MPKYSKYHSLKEWWNAVFADHGISLEHKDGAFQEMKSAVGYIFESYGDAPFLDSKESLYNFVQDTIAGVLKDFPALYFAKSA